MADAASDPVRAHLARVFPERGLAAASVAGGGLVVNLPELVIWELAPPAAEPGTPWLYVSSGA